ncbi:TPA: YbjN domain-containing protein [Corynebacterium striatum]|nr:YbjN domain-containing protein [Corynebacterium striatum]
MCNSCENKSLSRFVDDTRPVTLTRIMGTLCEVGIDFRVEGSESDVLVAEFSRHTVLIALEGAYGQLFSLKAVPKVNVHSSRAADLAFAVSESNNRLIWPASSFTEKEDRSLEVAMTIRHELRAGLSDTQLEDMIDVSMRSVQTALEILSEHVPELAGVPDGFTERFGESNTGTLEFVTLERVQRVLAAEGIKNVEMEPVVKRLAREDTEIEGPYLYFEWEDEADPEQLETPDH